MHNLYDCVLMWLAKHGHWIVCHRYWRKDSKSHLPIFLPPAILLQRESGIQATLQNIIRLVGSHVMSGVHVLVRETVPWLRTRYGAETLGCISHETKKWWLTHYPLLYTNSIANNNQVPLTGCILPKHAACVMRHHGDVFTTQTLQAGETYHQVVDNINGNSQLYMELTADGFVCTDMKTQATIRKVATHLQVVARGSGPTVSVGTRCVTGNIQRLYRNMLTTKDDPILVDHLAHALYHEIICTFMLPPDDGGGMACITDRALRIRFVCCMLHRELKPSEWESLSTPLL